MAAVETVTFIRRTGFTVRRLLAASTLLGPAFVAAIAYVDPGNVAANVSAGAKYGYLLVWVIVVSNLMAGVVQYLSAKLGVVAGRSLPEMARERMSRWPRLAYWGQAELVAIATDLAEVVGGAIALRLLFGLPTLVGGVITGVVSLSLLMVQNRRGQRSFELVVIALLAMIAIGFLASVVVSPPSVADAAHGLLPRFDGRGSVLLAVAILGATVMPHVVYLHSGLTRDRFGHMEPGTVRRRLLRVSRVDVVLAMLVAGAVNLAMLLLAAHSLRGRTDVDTIEGVHDTLGHLLGPGVALLFAVGLLASGLASTSVGAYAGAMIMEGLLNYRIPLVVRRVVTLIPALIVLGMGIDPTEALVVSQLLLSFGLPFALIPLVRFTSDPAVMGEDVNSRVTTAVAGVITALIVALNAVLIWLTLWGS